MEAYRGHAPLHEQHRRLNEIFSGGTASNFEATKTAFHPNNNSCGSDMPNIQEENNVGFLDMILQIPTC
jgi:hypothetical protein